MNAPVESNPPSLGPKSADTLEANLAALGSVNHVALAAIRAAEDREIEIETAEDGPLTPTEREELEALREEVKELRSLMSGLEEMLTEEQFSSLGASSSLAQVVNPRLTMH